MSIHKTVIKVVVLSDGPLPDTIEDGSWLGWVARDIDDGASIGDWTIESAEVLPPARVRDELLAIHNDGEFFDDLDPWQAGQ